MRKEPLRKKIIIYSMAPFAAVLATAFVPVVFVVRLIGASWEIAEEWMTKMVGDA